MGMFQTREPRRYRRVNIYTDESRDRLQRIVDEVRREQGEQPAEEKPFDPESIKGTFINYTPRAKKHKENGSRFGWPLLIVLLLVLIIVWRFLLTGDR